MSPSIYRLILTSIAVVAVLGFGIMITFAWTREWTEADARRVGVVWVYGALDSMPAAQRAGRLAEMQEDVSIPLALVDAQELGRRVGHEPVAGELIPERTARREQWVFVAFSDGDGGLVAGPFDPVNPFHQFPIGVVLLLVLGPLVAVLAVARLTRQLRKVEQASEALGAGVLSARVDNPRGPSSELAESFNRMAEHVEQLVNERDELLQAVSHELGSPLARLRVQLELLADGDEDDEEASTRIDAMAQQMDELDQLVEDLSRWIQSDEAALRPVPFDAMAPMADLMELARYHETANPDAEIELVAPPRVGMFADPRQFQRVVDNLLRNAMRYARQRVRVVVEEQADGCAVAVHDDGHGIPAEERGRVLEPFARLGTARDRESGGVGLGLAIVHRIVTGHGGTVVIGDSELGGAEVRTTWPRGVS